MSRTISSDLQSAQEQMNYPPYIHLLFTSRDGGTTYDYSSVASVAADRILRIQHVEEAYNDYAVVILRNEDRSIPDLRGYWTEIGYGYYISGAGDYEATPRLWVKSQQTVSKEGVLQDVLLLEGMWAKLRELPYRVGDPPYYLDGTYAEGGSTVYAIIDAILSIASMSLDAIGTQSDGIIDVFKPNFSINIQPFEYAAALLYRLIRMTKCYMRPKAGLEWKIVYPQTDDTVKVTYYSHKAHWFWEYDEKKNALIPNHVVVFANANSDGSWDAATMITGEADESTDTSAPYEVYKLHIAGNITNQTDADNRAAVILARAKAEILGGRALVPHDVRVELHDRLKFVDYRSG